MLTALDVLGYERPARLRSQAGLVGLIVPELENPIFPAFAQVMEPLLERNADFFAFKQDDDPEAVLAWANPPQSSG